MRRIQDNLRGCEIRKGNYLRTLEKVEGVDTGQRWRVNDHVLERIPYNHGGGGGKLETGNRERGCNSTMEMALGVLETRLCSIDF